MSEPDTETTRHAEEQEKGQQVTLPALQYNYDFPDGGLAAWSVVVGAFIALFSTFGLINAFGVFQQFYARPGGLLSNKTNSDIAWIGSVQVFFLFAMSCIVGPVFDRVATWILMAPGLVLLVLGLMMQSICQPGQFYQFFLAQGVLQGIGIGMFFLPAVTSVQHWFMKRRALATGIAVAGSSIGGVIWPIMLNRLLNYSTLGYGWTIRIVGFMVLALGSLSVLLCKKRLPPASDGKKPDTSFIRNPKYLLCLVSFFLVIFGLFTPFFFITEYAVLKGIDPNLGFYLLAIINAGSLFGRVLPGFIADKIGRLNMLIPMVTGTAVVTFGIIGVSSPAGFIIVSILFGFFSGAVVSLQPVVLASLIPDTRSIGMGIGLSFALSSMAGLAGTPAAGAIVTTSTGFTGVFAYSGAFIGAGALLFIVARLLPEKP